MSLKIYYCRDCTDDWTTHEEETHCTQCLGDNIRFMGFGLD
tara:strand:+ start:651 stop:773 length:123 start_codon:yes stop_codon:yes gene_type:complete